jgi:hypothetical protein
MNRRQIIAGLGIGGAAVAAGAVATAKPPPSARISCEKGDPGERLYSILCGDRKEIKIYLNGVEVKDGVVTVDPQLGMIKRAVVTPGGNRAYNNVTGELYYEEVFGEVHWEAFDP